MRNRLTVLRALAFAAVCGFPCLADAQGLSALRFEQYIESLRQQAGIPGLSAAIVQNGAIAWEKGFGEADVERVVTAGPLTPYPIAGLTALFSAVQALQCAETGRVTLATPVIEFFPAYPDGVSTLGHALTHTPGGLKYEFDPDHYDAVAAAIKVCTGKTLRASLTDDILDQLGMASAVPGHDFASWSAATIAQFPAATVDRYRDAMARLAKPYRANPRGKPTPTTFSPTTGLTGASGVVASVHDLALFQANLDRGTLLRPETLRQAWTAPAQADGRPGPHAYGWFSQVHDGQLVVWQFGVIPDAYSALLMTLPQRNVTLILLANSDALVQPYQLVNGDISVSPFARLFLGLF